MYLTSPPKAKTLVLLEKSSDTRVFALFYTTNHNPFWAIKSRLVCCKKVVTPGQLPSESAGDILPQGKRLQLYHSQYDFTTAWTGLGLSDFTTAGPRSPQPMENPSLVIINLQTAFRVYHRLWRTPHYGKDLRSQVRPPLWKNLWLWKSLGFTMWKNTR